jgi:transposase-like protein
MIKTTNRYALEVQRRAAQVARDHERHHASRWATVLSISAKIGCTARTSNKWVRKADVDTGGRAGVLSEVARKLKALEHENRELRRANEVLRKVLACFAIAELDGPFNR